MVFKIIWSVEAINDYNFIVIYLMSNWTFDIVESFNFILNKKIEILTLQPFIGKSTSKYKNIRSILITKHNKLFYVVKDNTIEVLNIFDTRQDPIKAPY